MHWPALNLQWTKCIYSRFFLPMVGHSSLVIHSFIRHSNSFVYSISTTCSTYSNAKYIWKPKRRGGGKKLIKIFLIICTMFVLILHRWYYVIKIGKPLVFAAFQGKTRQDNIYNILYTVREHKNKQSKTCLRNFYYVKLQIRCEILRESLRYEDEKKENIEQNVYFQCKKKKNSPTCRWSIDQSLYFAQVPLNLPITFLPSAIFMQKKICFLFFI